MHWFLQCIRPIHSALTKTSAVHLFTSARRTGSERRQSAARGSIFSKLPPLAASLLTKDAHADKQHKRYVFCWGFRLYPCASSTERHIEHNTIGPSALSSSLAGSSLPTRTGRDCLATHARHTQIVTNVSEPSLETPLAFPHQFYSGHSPTRRHFAPKVCYFHLTDHARHRVANPEAAVLPALVSVFSPRVTLLETPAESCNLHDSWQVYLGPLGYVPPSGRPYFPATFST